jgi:hypothetical protein
LDKKTEALQWISRRQGVWNRKLNKILDTSPVMSVHLHVDQYAEHQTALRVLEELANLKTILKEPENVEG